MAAEQNFFDRSNLSEEERIDYELSVRQGQVVGGIVLRATAESLTARQAANPLAYEGLRRQVAEELRVRQEAINHSTPPEGWIPLKPQSKTDAA